MTQVRSKLPLLVCRLMLSLLLATTAVIKICHGWRPEVSTSWYVYWASIGVELAAVVLLTIGMRGAGFVVALVFSVVGLVVTHAGNKPCGCLGPWDLARGTRAAVLGGIGALAIMGLQELFITRRRKMDTGGMR